MFLFFILSLGMLGTSRRHAGREFFSDRNSCGASKRNKSVAPECATPRLPGANTI